MDTSGTCKLSFPERTAIVLGFFTRSDPIDIVQVDGGYNFATEYTAIHRAMPLLYDFSTNKQIAREACEVFYKVQSHQLCQLTEFLSVML